MEDIEKNSTLNGKVDAETQHSDSSRSDHSITPAGSIREPIEEPDPDDRSDAHSISNQRLPLSHGRLVVALIGLSVSLFVSFVDQTGVSTAVPAISAELQTGSSSSWIAASFLIASTSFQLVNGRLSDIFGRKNCMLVALILLALGDLLAGFAKTKEQLFALRAIAGVGGGGVNSIAMIIVSDITTLENRGIYQGLLGAIIGVANGVGPFIGGAVVTHSTWRWIFRMVPMLAVPAAIALLFFMPLRHDGGNYVAKAKKIDYGGVLLNLAAVLLILVSLCVSYLSPSSRNLTADGKSGFRSPFPAPGSPMRGLLQR